METRERKFSEGKISPGSALILTVVLTGMLAIVGVMFVMMARVDKVATSAISENRELDLAIETVIAGISQELVSDIPGVAGQEYYDYPDPCNAWLASLEPEFITDMGTPADANDDIYKWPQISDVTGFLRNRPFPFATQYVNVDPVPGWGLFNQDFIPEYPPIRIDHNNGQLGTGPPDDGRFDNEWRGQLADADGDGITDSKWFELYDVGSSKGKKIYAAVRVVDPGATLNVNTAFKFDPCEVPLLPEWIDGSSQMQINLAGLARPFDDVNEIDIARSGSFPPVSVSLDWRTFQNNVIWRMEHPVIGYLPFDISDELELRYRYCITSQARTRLENVWDNTIGDLSFGFKDEPYSGGNRGKRYEWQWAVTDPAVPINFRRHLLTTYNVDSIIDARGGRMINVNNGNVPVDIPYERYTRLFPLYPLDMNTPVGILYDRLLSSYERLLSGLGPVVPDPNIVMQYAQLAANIVDFSDHNTVDIDNTGVLYTNCVTTLVDPYGNVHYGFEAQPFITEIAWRIGPTPSVTPNYFALELYNPFNVVIDLNDFALEFINRYNPADQYSIEFPENLDGTPIVWINPDSRCVIVNEAGRFNIYSDPNKPTTIKVEPIKFFDDWISSEDRSKPPVDTRPDPDKGKPPIPQGRWGESYDVFLRRKLLVPPVGTEQWIYVDSQPIEPDRAVPGSIRALGRDDRDWRVIYPDRDPNLAEDADPRGSLGMANYLHIGQFPIHDFSFFFPNPLKPPARFVTVGDVPRLLTLGHGVTRNSTIGQQLLDTELLQRNTALDQEHRVRLNLRDPNNRNVFQYLTVFDPTLDFIDNDGDGLGIDGDNNGFLDSNEIDFDEVKIPGRININTAPWHVIAQLPWITNEMAQAIVAYRDKLGIPVDYRDPFPPPAPPAGRFNATGIVGIREQPGFASVGELNFIIAGLGNFNIAQFAIDGFDLPDFPDLTTDDDDLPGFPDDGDEVIDDFEERDVIFSRISNLVSVRSDVFTAYILVRIGADGPQKRAIAILDRSGVNKTNFRTPDGKVRIVSLHYVPDPR
jgi:hypothetical protein